MKNIFAIFVMVALSATAFAEDSAITAQVLKQHKAITGDECQADLPAALSTPEIYDVGNGVSLYVVQCMMGAYQGYGKGYSVVANSEGGLSIKQVMVLAYDEELKAVVATADLPDASYDTKTKKLSTNSRGTGMGDCGQSSISQISLAGYSGIYVKTVQIRDKSNCDGKMNAWPVVFKQK
jgi:hypothetical protein